MITRTRAVFVGAVVLLTCGSPLTAQQLPSDPTFVRGELENGLRYIVRSNAEPPGKATMWVHIHSGSLNETDRQRGLAHYLEHMAFNGSENFAPGTLVPFFQSLGMTFGRDQNAFTNFEQTTYQLTLPNTTDETLGKGMLFFSDVVGRLSLRPDEIEAERGIIQEERRRGLSGRQRTSFYVIGKIAPGSIYGERITIGTEQTIASVQEQDFRDYYGKWYGASNATLIVVGDAEPERMVKLIKENFGTLPKKPRPTPQDVGIKAYGQSFAIVASDPELRSADVRIQRIEPPRPPTTTIEQYHADLVARLGTSAFNRRMGDKVARGGTAFQGANVSIGNDPSTMFSAGISGRATADKWKPALEEIALELQRGRMFGFSPREIDESKKQIMSGAERAVETEPSQTTGGIIARLNGDVASGEPTMSAPQRLALLKQVLPTITPEEVSKRFADELKVDAVAFVAVLPSDASVPTESELLEMGTKALTVTPSADEETTHADQLMTEFPKGGEVKELTEHEATKVWTGWLSNNTHVNYRFMDVRQNEVSISISLAGGELLETADTRGLTRAAELAWSRPTTKHLTSTDIRELMSGSKVSVRGGGGFGGGGRGGGGRRGGGGGGGGGGDTISLNISGSPAELEKGFQLAYLLLTEPKIEPTAFEQFQTNGKTMLEEMTKNPMMFGGRMVNAATYPDTEPRTKPLTEEQYDRLTVDAAQAWLDKLLRESPLEVTIVGDLPRERAMELTAKYVGSLPTRDRIAPTTFATLRQIERPKGPRLITKSIETQTPQAFVHCGFYGTDEKNIDDTRYLNMAARVLSTRMIKEVREDAQLVYSIGASSRAGSTYPGFGMFSASAPTDPTKAPALVEKIGSMYREFAQNGPTDEEMTVAKKQFANTLEESMREPAFWSGRLSGMTLHGGCLDDIMTAPEAYQQMTKEQVRETFAKYWSPENEVTVVVKPEKAAPATN